MIVEIAAETIDQYWVDRNDRRFVFPAIAFWSLP
jgi:hypothetical protein